MEHTEGDLPHLTADDIGHQEFESFVANDMFGSLGAVVDNLTVRLHETITGSDGTYDFDATLRYGLGGLDFLVVVEAKRHRNRIKRSLVANLHSQALSVGAHKAVMVSTADYQSGAVEFALVHGIGLITVTSSQVAYVAKGPAAPGPRARVPGGAFLVSPQEIAREFGVR